jgi:formylglycine-generating enzyme required for sulfatase activity
MTSLMAAAGPVFVSYSSQNADIAARFVQAIEAAGLRCWIAPRDIPAGSSYPAEITQAIGSAAAMLVIVTPAANASPHVLREVEMAFNGGKPILPVHLTTVALSPNLNYFLSTRQWFDAGEAFDSDDTVRVVRSLQQLLDTPAGVPPLQRTGDSSPAQPAVRQRYRLLAAAVTLVLVVAGLYVFMRPARPAMPPIRPAEGVVTTAPRERPSSPDGGTASGDPSKRADDAAKRADNGPTPAGPTSGDATSPSRGRGSLVNAIDGQTYLLIPAGEFTMGCSTGDPSCDTDEQPPHQVTIARPFWLARTEVTGAQYRKVRPKGEGRALTPDSPITEVTWADAKAYCKAIGGRLPREAEWEYAARGGTTTRAYGPLDAIGWSAKNSDDHAHPVAQRQPNHYGLYDMLGNVHEWVLDRYYNSYSEDDDSVTVVEPLAPNASATIRGGAWTSEAKGLRASARLERPPDAADPNIGFRCAMD